MLHGKDGRSHVPERAVPADNYTADDIPPPERSLRQGCQKPPSTTVRRAASH